ncbi:hypothetical protein M434DRAFT_39066 [Hypoxylon sp. CO27-5]|nr:hypothetical protein M434DRAFT_39066 [Hypoxylon sp. CO27-5]
MILNIKTDVAGRLYHSPQDSPQSQASPELGIPEPEFLVEEPGLLPEFLEENPPFWVLLVRLIFVVGVAVFVVDILY